MGKLTMLPIHNSQDKCLVCTQKKGLKEGILELITMQQAMPRHMLLPAFTRVTY
jgi:hypothetical protein